MPAGNRAPRGCLFKAHRLNWSRSCLPAAFCVFDPRASKIRNSASSISSCQVLHAVSPHILNGEPAAYAYYLPKWIRRPRRGCLCDCSLQLATLDARSPTAAGLRLHAQPSAHCLFGTGWWGMGPVASVRALWTFPRG